MTPSHRPSRTTATARLIATLGLPALLGAAAIALLRVDTPIGAPLGPERLLQSIDAHQTGPAQTAPTAIAILRDRPIDGRAFRVLATLAAHDRAVARANTLYAIAARRAPRDRLARAALADRAFAEGDTDAAFLQLDALFRVGPGYAEPLLRTLLPSMAQPGMQAALIARLASNPPWRPALARALRGPDVDPRSALDLLTHVAGRLPLTDAERAARIALLQDNDRDAEARQQWLDSLPPAAQSGSTRLFDGGFEHAGIEGAYAWQQTPSPGVDIGIDTRPAEGAQALALVFSGRVVQSPGLQQALALVPGNYRLGFASDNGTDATRPFAWTITCRNGVRLLSAPLPVGEAGGWRRSGADFSVPAGCPAQTLRLDLLARSLVERQLAGTLRVDALRLDPR